MKKILFIAPNLHHGGAEAVLIKTLNNFDLEKYKIKLLLLKKEGAHLEKLRNDIDIIDLNKNRAIYSWLSIIKTINKEKPNYVFSITGHLNIIMGFIKVFYNNIIFIGRENTVHSNLFSSRKQKLYKFAAKLFLGKLDKLIVQSNFMKKEVEQLFNITSRKIIVLNNPIDFKQLENRNKKSELKEKGIVNLLAIGRLEQIKNYYEMIDIVSQLPDNYILEILGDGTLKDELKNYCKLKGVKERVIFRGYVSNPYLYMEKADIVLLTSFQESFPNVVLEANACGTYVISYRMKGGIEEIIKHKINGSLIPFGEKEMFAKEIENIISSKYDSLQIKQTSQVYSVDKYMNNFYKIFE